MNKSALPLPGLITLTLVSLLSFPALAQPKPPSSLGGPITPSQNPFANPYNNTVPSSRPPKLQSDTEERPVVLQRDQESTLLLKPLHEDKGPAPFLEVQQRGVRFEQVNR